MYVNPFDNVTDDNLVPFSFGFPGSMADVEVSYNGGNGSSDLLRVQIGAVDPSGKSKHTEIINKCT